MGIVPKIRRFFIGEKPSSPTEARLLRKIDTVLLAYLCLSQFMNFLDRQNITNAYVSGMAEDVGFKGLDYNITQTIFQVGYIVGGIPQSLIVSSNRIRLSIWLPLCCMGWGMTNLGVAFSTQVYQIQICRFFMALFESVSFAGGHYVLGIWYKPSELGKRAALLTASQNTGGLFAGVMQGAIYSTLNGRLGMAGWRWMILVNTLMTIPVALFGFFTFPDTPQDCRRAWLSKEELQVAIDRVPERVQTKLSWKTFKRIFLEWRFWAFTFQFSFNTIMEWSGLFAPMQLWMRWTGWYTVPQINYYPLGTTAIIITSTFFFALWSDYTQSRWWVNCVMATFSGVAAIILLVWEIPTAAKYFAWYLAGMGYIGQATNFAWANEMCRDNDQLRAYTLYAMVYGSNVSIAVFGIAFFPVTDLPRFTKGYAGSLAICILSPPLAYAIHRACKARAARLKMEAEAAGTIEYRPADSPAAEAQYEDVDEKKGELVIPEEGDVKVSEVPVSMVR